MNRHGLSNHPLYRVWNGMKQRCKNPHDDFFYCYGARGIKVCSDWCENFKYFYKWAVENGYHKGFTIDRKDTDGEISIKIKKNKNIKIKKHITN